MGLEAWAGEVYGGTAFEDFSSRAFLAHVVPKLSFAFDPPSALELGTGVGPGALFLAAHGFRVTGYDVIPEAIETARRIAAEKRVPIRYEVVDVTQTPHDGERFDLVVDSFCLNHIVFADERTRVFESVKARLAPEGFYLISSSVYEPSRHQASDKVVDRRTGRTYDLYDGDCLYDPETDYYYAPVEAYPSERDATERLEDLIEVNGETFIPMRCYRDERRLREELESHGFDVIFQSGEFGENAVCTHTGRSVDLGLA